VLTASLFQRFVSRGEDEFAAKLLSAMRISVWRPHREGRKRQVNGPGMEIGCQIGRI